MCENLTTTIEKLDISRQKFFGDEQLLTLLKRCNKLTEFSFGFTLVSDTSVDTIITTLSQTLIKINPSHLISFPKLLQIAKMPKLKVLSNTSVIKSYLKDEKLEIASPNPSSDSPIIYALSGFWEIEGKPHTIDRSY